MADTKYSRSKSPKSYKAEEFSKPKMRKSKHHSRKEVKDTKQQIECKTPPLPPSSSLDDLLKQRDNLKEELEKITKHPKYDLEIRHNLHENRIKFSNLKIPQHAIKRSYVEETDTHNNKKNRKMSDQPPDNDEGHIDSDDEENIIEQRRIQRKQLLEKLNFSFTNKPNSDSIINEIHDHGNNLNADQDAQITSDKSEFMKEPTDMFSDKDFSNNEPDIVTQDNSNAQLSDNWDDAEGYYNVRVGDIIDSNKYTIKSILGQGVFANVVLAQENKSKTEVAIKIMRNNDLIYKTGLKELALLKAINETDPDSKHHCIKFIRNFMHKGHLCVVLEPLYMDMRKVIKKYGKHHGLNMKAVVSYSRQLLMALRLLKKMGIVHADVKPDNILVNEKKNILKLCDFGSASKVGENDMTPYLVSRFYRAPEIILGLPYNNSIDVWSAACTVYEMATGKIMFMGSSNNKMLKCFMDLKGKFSSKLIRKGKFKDQHFNYSNSFLLHKKDEVSGREKFIELSNINATRDLLPELKKSHKNANSEIENKLMQLKDFLEKMLALDINQRMMVNDCLRHPFIQESLTK